MALCETQQNDATIQSMRNDDESNLHRASAVILVRNEIHEIFFIEEATFAFCFKWGDERRVKSDRNVNDILEVWKCEFSIINNGIWCIFWNSGKSASKMAVSIKQLVVEKAQKQPARSIMKL
jgi:hypothetical protein